MRKKKTLNAKGQRLSAPQLQSAVLRLFKRHPKKRLNPKQVARKLKVSNNKDSVQAAIDKLVESQQLIDMGEFKYKLKVQPRRSSPKSFHEGIVDMTRSGSAYIMIEELEDDVHVSAKYMNTALNGDKVRIKVWVPPGRRRAEGEILEVIERATEHFIGSIKLFPKHAVVVPDTNDTLRIEVPNNFTKGAENGDKVVVKVTKWHDEEGSVEGKVTSVLGQTGSSDIEMKSILIKNGFNLEFPDEVIQESERLSMEVTDEELEKRWDMREVPTFTIDPTDAKDFDDALSLRYLDNGHLEIGVHIADVTHYVQAGTALDKEAFERSTSVYLVDRVLPMLPEKISNELCSLRPNEDKFTFSAVFEFDKNNKIQSRWFGRTITHSNRRFTYGQAQNVLDSGEGDFADELRVLNKVALALRKRRFREGAINFDTEEVRFRLDENGVPVEVFVKERKDAHMLIEDFMLLANREVATYMHRLGVKFENEVPFVYRIHDQPDMERVAEFARFAMELGVELDVSTPQAVGRSYNRLLKAAKTDAHLKLLEPLAIRTMAKAEYSPDNIGHYGLGFDYYTHFTSPIRRYSDVLAHRILDLNLNVERPHRAKHARLTEQCKHISIQERKANDAERESVKYKQVEFMEKHVGEEFAGQINGIIERGIFVELLENRCEGFVPFETMDEPFNVGPASLRIKGRRSGAEYKMGDEIRVRIVSTDLRKRRIEMAWVSPEEE
ncbi:MAG: ribonuclease R [Bacteroidota bacterium]